MIINIILISFAVAGVAILWRNMLYDNVGLKEKLKKLPKYLRMALTCGFCFTFWLALITVLIFDPLQGWLPPLRISLPEALFQLVGLMFSWMIVGTIAAIVRFGYIAIQEFVHYEVHDLNHKEH